MFRQSAQIKEYLQRDMKRCEEEWSKVRKCFQLSVFACRLLVQKELEILKPTSALASVPDQLIEACLLPSATFFDWLCLRHVLSRRTHALLFSDAEPRAPGPHVTRTMLPGTSSIEAQLRP